MAQRLLRAVKWVAARCAAEASFLGEVRQAEALSAMQAAYPPPAASASPHPTARGGGGEVCQATNPNPKPSY